MTGMNACYTASYSVFVDAMEYVGGEPEERTQTREGFVTKYVNREHECLVGAWRSSATHGEEYVLYSVAVDLLPDGLYRAVMAENGITL